MKLRALRYTLLLSGLFGISFLLRASLPSVATGTWVAAGNMSAARSGACTVALNDGRLLISGGADANGPTATADLFSTTGSWSAAASMNSPRSHQSCAVLQDGRVLVAGGTTSGGGVTNSAEIYDPSADSWSQAGLMNDARSGATASVLQDGRVLIAGGRSSDGPPILISNTLEVFDPNSGNFSNAGTMSSPRQDHAAAVLSDGRVLIVGGSSDGTNALNTTDIYDPQAGSVSAGPAMSTPRAKHTATTLLDGTVIVIGGSNGTADLASAEFFDPAANNFNAAGSLAAARSKHSAFLLPNNNEVLVVGGQSPGADPTLGETDLASAELYIPWQKAFPATGAMATPRSDATGAALTAVDGRLLIAGGSSASAELYGFATVKTDAADYPPGTTVNITGSGWQPAETVALTLVESPLIDTHGPYTVTADAFGNISDSSFVTDLHDANVKFSLTAVGLSSNWQAQNTFTDAPQKPTSTITFPADGASYQTSAWTSGAPIAGTATFATGTTSRAVNVSIKRNSTGKFWNGTGFTNSTETGTSLRLATLSGSTLTLAFPASNFPADDSYTVHSVASDSNGTENGTTASTFTLDNAPPAAPTGLTLAAGSDTGSSQSDEITDLTTKLNFSGMAEAKSTVNVFVDGSTTSAGSGTTGNGGNWNNITAAGTLSEGTHSIRATATDQAGNVSTLSSPLTFTIDTTAPTMGLSPASGTVNTPFSFSWSITDPISGGVSSGVNTSTCKVTVDAVQVSTACSGSRAITTAGAHTVVVSASDIAGNAGSDTRSYTVVTDNQAPVVTVSFPAPVHGSGGWYNAQDTVPVVGTVSADDTTTGNSNVTAISCSGATVGAISGLNTHTASASLTVSGDGTHNVSCTATDSASNTGASAGSTAMPVVVKIDTVAPTGVAAATSRAADHNGWYTSAVTITFSGTDTISGIASCTSTNYSGPDSATASVTGHCTDNAGNSSADATFNFKYDGTAPTAVALSVTAGTVGANGWYTSDVTVHTSGTETVSTPLSCTADQFQTAETAGQVFNGSCTNDAGLTTNATALTIKLDKTGPTADLVVTAGTAGTNGWYTSDVTVHASGNDTISNPVTCTSDQVISTETTGTPVNGSCTNNAGLRTNAPALTVKLDKTAPLVTLAVTTGTAGTNGWYTSNVTVHTSGTETISNPISCVADQLQTTETTGAAFNGSCTNDAGLTGHAAPLTVKLDKTGPSATLAVFAGTLGDNGWYVSDVTVRASGTDSISTPVSCTADQFLTTDSAGHVFSGSCTNDAGLSTNATDLTVKLDKTPPTVNITSDRGADHNGWYNHALTFTNLGTDATSGIASCTTPAAYSGPDSGSASVSASCKDNAGNTGNGSFSFMYDATPPTSVGGAPNRVPDHNGWFNHTVDVVFTGNDVTSGIDSCSTVNYTGPDTATASVMGSCTDKAGNSSTPQVASSSFKFDSTPPTAALAVTAGTPGANGWYTSNVTVSTSGTDTVSNPTVCTADQFQTAETTGAAFNGECTNDAGLSTNAAPLTVKLDKTAPTNVALAVTAGTLGHNSWYVSNVTIHTSGDENISTPIVCTLDQFQTTDTAGQLFHGSCTNDAGLSANASDITVKRDATPPVVHITPTRAADHNGWYNHSLSFTNPGTDATSGIASCTAPAAYSAPDTATASVSASCEDEAGNTANDSFSFMYDATPPTNVAGAPNRVPDHNGWYNHAVDVVYGGNDPTSGIEACSTINYAAPDTTTASVMGHCTDVAGNSSADVASSSFKFDATAPNLTGNRAPGPNGYGWNNVDVTATFSCSDSTSGVDVGPVTAQVVSAEGADQSRSASCADVAGNSSNFTVNHINIDKTNPTIVLTITPGSPAVTGWYNISTGKPTVTFTCGDALSGVATCTPPVLVGEGANQTISGTATDKAGNSASTSVMHVNVDVTAPTINLVNPANGNYILNQSANASYSCNDAGSSGLVAGSAGCGGPVASGLQFDTASVGSKNFTVNAKDVAGNTASQTNTYGIFYSTGACLGSAGHTILQPINFTGDSVFPKKQGSTVPAKFRVCDANGNSIGTAGVVTSFSIIQVYNGTAYSTTNETVDSTTPDTAFRWDSTGLQWIYNISAKNLSPGSTYYFRIVLNDDNPALPIRPIDFDFGLR